MTQTSLVILNDDFPAGLLDDECIQFPITPSGRTWRAIVCKSACPVEGSAFVQIAPRASSQRHSAAESMLVHSAHVLAILHVSDDRAAGFLAP